MWLRRVDIVYEIIIKLLNLHKSLLIVFISSPKQDLKLS